MEPRITTEFRNAPGGAREARRLPGVFVWCCASPAPRGGQNERRWIRWLRSCLAPPPATFSAPRGLVGLRASRTPHGIALHDNLVPTGLAMLPCPMIRTLLLLPLCLTALPLIAQDKPVFRAEPSPRTSRRSSSRSTCPAASARNGAESAHDPLHARALVLDDGTTALAMVVVDNIGLSPALIVEAKQLASQKTGNSVERILISSTHTHSAPSSGGARRAVPRPPTASGSSTGSSSPS